ELPRRRPRLGRRSIVRGDGDCGMGGLPEELIQARDVSDVFRKEAIHLALRAWNHETVRDHTIRTAVPKIVNSVCLHYAVKSIRYLEVVESIVHRRPQPRRRGHLSV